MKQRPGQLLLNPTTRQARRIGAVGIFLGVLRAFSTWWSGPGRKRFVQVVAQIFVRRLEFKWYYAVLLMYFGLLWRSTKKTSLANGGNYWRRIYAKSNSWRTFIAAHGVLWKYLLTKASLGALMLQNVALAPVDFVGKQSAALQDSLQSRMENFLDRQMDFFAEKVKQLLKDPYMPISIQGTIDDFVDVLLPDLKLALFTKTNEYIRSYRGRNADQHHHQRRSKRKSDEERNDEVDSVLDALEDDEDDYDSSYESGGESDAESVHDVVSFRGLSVYPNKRRQSRFSYSNLRNRALSIRAWVLYTTSPFDRSIWRSVRNPYYVLLQVIGLIPGINMIWWLFVFVLHDKRDEYQLSQFIVGFQTAKFFSQGFFNLVRGAFLYYLCANRDVPRCDTYGPKVRDYFDGLFFFVQIILVWLTFFILPYSEPCFAVNDPRDLYLLDEDRKDRSQAALRAKVRLGRGGRLMKLFWYDTVSVFIVLVLAAIAYFVLEQRDWQLRTTLYWLGTMYGLTSFPFVFFKIPVMGALLTPTKATGYTRTGQTVIRVAQQPPQTLLDSQKRAAEIRVLVRRPSNLLNPAGGLPIAETKKKPIGKQRDSVNDYVKGKLSSFFLSDKFEDKVFEMEMNQSIAVEDEKSAPSARRRKSEIQRATSTVANETTDSSSLASAQFLRDLHRLRRSSSILAHDDSGKITSP